MKWQRRVLVGIAKALGIVLSFLLLLFLALWLVLKVPAVQNYAVQKTLRYVREKTHTRIELKRIDLAFPTSLVLEGVFLEDEKADTLLALQKLEVDIHFWALLHKKVVVGLVDLQALNARVERGKAHPTFNFQFLLDAFAGKKQETEVAKDTTPSSWEIEADEIRISNSHISFQDSLSGTFLQSNIGKIALKVRKLDLTQKELQIQNLELSGIQAGFTKGPSFLPDTSSGEGNGWNTIGLDRFRATDIQVLFADHVQKTRIFSRLGTGTLSKGQVDLVKRSVKVQTFTLANSRSSLLFQKDSVGTAPAVVDTVVAKVQEGWKIEVGKALVTHSGLQLDYGKKDSTVKGIDYSHLLVQELNTQLEDVFLQGQRIRSRILRFNVKEKNSGFAVTSLKTEVDMDAKHIALKGLDLHTPYSHLGQSVSMAFRSMDRLTDSLALTCSLDRNRIALREVLLLAPFLEKNEFLAKNKQRVLDFSLKASGTLDKMDIQAFQAKTADSTFISLHGEIWHAKEVDKLRANLQIPDVRTTSKEVQTLLPDSLLPTSISLPQWMQLSGSYQGTLLDFESKWVLHSSDGEAQLTAKLGQLKSNAPEYAISLAIPRYRLGRLIQQTSLGEVSGNLSLNGKSFDKNQAEATLQADIQAFRFQNYTYRNVRLESEVHQALADVRASVQDSNLSLRLNASAGWKTHQEFCKADIALLGADAYRLGWAQTPLQTSASMAVSVEGISLEEIKGNVQVRNIVLVKQGKEYRMDSLSIGLENNDAHSQLSLESPIVRAHYEGNLNALSVVSALQQHVDRYVDIFPRKAESWKGRKFKFDGRVEESDLVKEVLFPSLTDYDPIVLHGGFDSDSAHLWAEVDLPQVVYDGMQWKEAQLSVDSDKEKLSCDASLSSFKREGVNVPRTSLHVDVKDNQANLGFRIADSTGKEKLSLQTLLAKMGQNYRFSIAQDGLKIQEQSWEVDKGNYIEFGPKKLFVHQFGIGYKGQSLFANSTNETSGADLEVKVNHFHLHTLSRIVEQDDSLFKGTIDGEVLFRHYQQNLAFTSDLRIAHLAYKNSKIGDVWVKADNLQASQYTLEATLTGYGNDLHVSGNYHPVKEGNALQANIDIKALQLSSLESFFADQISHSSGSVQGNFAINGALSQPSVSGSLSFHEAKAKVMYLNEVLLLKNETAKVTDEGIFFSSFTVLDTAGNTAKLDGSIGMKSFQDIRFNLDLATDHFLVLNTTAIQNKMYYGKVAVDSKIKLRGTPDLPKVNATISIVRGSKFTFTVPESRLSVDKGEGVVVFLFDSSKVDPIMLRGMQVASKLGAIKGLDLNSHLKIDHFSTLKVVVDPISGDSLVVRGNADLDFGMDLSGKMSLSGTYVLASGSYKTYIEENFITREFALVKDGKITWNGDPMDAYVDLSARYDVRTSSKDLMTIGSAGTIVTDSSLLMKSLLFNVYLMMQGELLKPQISFRLDMPEDERATAGGAIYAKVNEVNQDQAELNKQVFALLVLSKFIPATATGGSGTSASSFARSSVSKIMTDQLNQLSGRYLKGAEINVDLQSYNYSQNGRSQSSTQLNLGVKKDFNRFTVQVGSNVQLEGQQAAQQNNVQNFTGDIQVGYKLTTDGRYQAKAFRQNEVDGLVNGVITETGAGIMYRRDYNSLKELLSSPKKKQKK